MSVTESQTIFFAGTDTEVGKTYVAALFARAGRDSGLSVGVYKPVASGCVEKNGTLVSEDAVRLWESAGQPRSLNDVCPQRFLAPLAPNESAKAEGKTVDRELLRHGAGCWEYESDILIVEGAGGLLSPLADGFLNIDLVRQFQPARLVVVAANRLGTIHQTLATCAAAAHHAVTVDGILLCNTTPDADQSSASNAEQIRQFGDTPILGVIDYGLAELPASIAAEWLN